MEQQVQQKRGRGRPPGTKKRQVENKNEEREQIKMSDNSDISSQKSIDLNNISQRWSQLYEKFGSQGVTVEKWNQAYKNTFLSNPFLQNSRVKQITSQGRDADKKNIQKALENPADNEQFFREVSVGLNYQNYVYNNLLRLSRDIPCYHYYVTPQYLEKSEMKQDKFKNEIKFVNRLLDKFNPPLALKTINMQVQMEGKCTYLIRKSYNYPNKVHYFLLQKLNSDMVKITGIGSKQQYIASFNMMIFLNPMYDVSLYPPYIQEIWKEMQETGMVVKDELNGNLKFQPRGTLNNKHILECVNESYCYWVELNQDDCITFGQDMSTPACLPETIGLFLDFKELADYRWLMGNLMSKSVTSILTGTVPIQKDAGAGSDATIITPDLIMMYDTMFSNMVSNNVMTYFAPFTDFKLHEIDNQPDNMNIVYNRIRDLIATSGNSALLSISDKPSIAMTKGAQAIASARSHYLTLQFQQFLNNTINEQFGLKYQYKVTLWGNNYDKEELKISKELLQNGVKAMLPKVLSAFNMNVEDMKTVNDYIDVLGIVIYDKNQSLNSNSASSGLSEENEVEAVVGKPKLEEDEIENDNTAISVEMGNNVSEIKEFSSQKYCKDCGSVLTEFETDLCDKCFAQRINN